MGLLFFKKDLRKHGSGNLGATNTYRILGAKAGIAVALLDILKGTLACFLPLLLGSSLNPILCGVLAIIGHVFSIFANFKGGKAVATSTGVFLFLSPIGIGIGFVFFVLSLWLFKYVSLSSMIAATSLFFYCLFFETQSIATTAFLINVAIIFLHRKNIQRITNGTESKINNFSKDK